MSLQHTLATGTSIARTNLRRDLRTVTEDRRRVAGIAVAVLAGLFPLWGVLQAAYAFGDAAADGALALGPVVRAGFVGTVVSLVLLATLQTVAETAVPDGADLLLTTTSTRAVLAGTLVANTVRLLGWVAVVGLPVGVAFALGAGAPELVVAAALAAVPVVAFAVVCGHCLGTLVRLASRHLPVGDAARAVVRVGLLVALMGAVQVGAIAAEQGAFAGVVDAVAGVVVAEYASLFFVGTPAGGVTVVGVATGVGFLAAGVGGLRVAAPLTERLWFTTVDAGDATTETHAGVPWPFDRTPSARVAWRYLLFAKRAPERLAHLTIVAFLAFPASGVALESPGVVVAFAGPAIVAVGVVVAGAAFCLNPLGDDGPVLPALLTSATHPRRFLRGRAIAGLALGLPLVATGSLAYWLGAQAGPASVLRLFAAGTALAVAGTGVALGLGAAVPKTDPEEVFGVETVRPSMLPWMGFVYGTTVVVAVGLVLAVAPVARWTSPTVHAGALAGFAVVVGLPAVGGYAYAVRRLARHEP